MYSSVTMRTPLVALGLLLALLLAPPLARGAGGPRILALGSTDFLDAGAATAALDAEVVRELGSDTLDDVAVILIADQAFGSLPAAVRQGLADFVEGGGALCLTGGPHAFGAGGYQAIAQLLPFELRSAADWRAIPFRPPVVLQPGHPILDGVEFITIGAVNDVDLRRGASEILRAAGGRSAGGASSYPSPLIAEVSVGAGRVLGLAFDPNGLGGMRDRDRFTANVLRYLLQGSRAARGS